MTDKLPEQACVQPEAHTGHLCELESQPEWDIIKQVTSNPSVTCENCGASANSPRNVCMPTEI